MNGIDEDGNVIEPAASTIRWITKDTIRGFTKDHIVIADDWGPSWMQPEFRGPIIIKVSIQDEGYPGRVAVNRFNRINAPFIRVEVIEDGQE